MEHCRRLKEILKKRPDGQEVFHLILKYRSVRQTFGQNPLTAKAKALKYLFENYPAHVYEYDLVAGSMRGMYVSDPEPHELSKAHQICSSYGSLGFHSNGDHFAPGYEQFLNDGIAGTMKRIDESVTVHADDPEKTEFLTAQKLVLEGFSKYIGNYAVSAADMAEKTDCE